MSTIFISGANRGIGLELVRQYATAGWQVHASCRQPAQATALKHLSDTLSPHIQIHALEVTDSEQIQALAQQLQGEALDILFNNAGIWSGHTSFGEINSQDWLQAFHINSIAPLKMMEAFVTQVAASEHKIMANMSSKMGSIADNGSGSSYIYRSSKTALNSVVKSAALDLQARHICVLALHPGWVKTDMGGPNAEIDSLECVTQLRHILAHASLSDSGTFFDIDGSVIPW